MTKVLSCGRASKLLGTSEILTGMWRRWRGGEHEHEHTTTLLFSARIACALFSLINMIRSSTVGFCDWMIRFGSEPGMDIGSLVRHGSLAGVHQVDDFDIDQAARIK